MKHSSPIRGTSSNGRDSRRGATCRGSKPRAGRSSPGPGDVRPEKTRRGEHRECRRAASGRATPGFRAPVVRSGDAWKARESPARVCWGERFWSSSGRPGAHPAVPRSRFSVRWSGAHPLVSPSSVSPSARRRTRFAGMLAEIEGAPSDSVMGEDGLVAKFGPVLAVPTLMVFGPDGKTAEVFYGAPPGPSRSGEASRGGAQPLKLEIAQAHAVAVRVPHEDRVRRCGPRSGPRRRRASLPRGRDRSTAKARTWPEPASSPFPRSVRSSMSTASPARSQTERAPSRFDFRKPQKPA